MKCYAYLVAMSINMFLFLISELFFGVMMNLVLLLRQNLLSVSLPPENVQSPVPISTFLISYLLEYILLP
uniref:Uncharacterized protein n=1 Tax=Octopus bimaculoides TaxID=37653 RepID=A0A0L8GQP1_OCTBM